MQSDCTNELAHRLSNGEYPPERSANAKGRAPERDHNRPLALLADVRAAGSRKRYANAPASTGNPRRILEFPALRAATRALVALARLFTDRRSRRPSRRSWSGTFSSSGARTATPGL